MSGLGSGFGGLGNLRGLQIWQCLEARMSFGGKVSFSLKLLKGDYTGFRDYSSQDLGPKFRKVGICREGSSIGDIKFKGDTRASDPTP